MTLTERLEALAALEAAATPGLWRAVIDDPMERGGTRSYVGAADRFKYICPADASDAAFIAAIRNAAPELLAVARAALAWRAVEYGTMGEVEADADLLAALEALAEKLP